MTKTSLYGGHCVVHNAFEDPARFPHFAVEALSVFAEGRTSSSFLERTVLFSGVLVFTIEVFSTSVDEPFDEGSIGQTVESLFDRSTEKFVDHVKVRPSAWTLSSFPFFTSRPIKHRESISFNCSAMPL